MEKEKKKADWEDYLIDFADEGAKPEPCINCGKQTTVFDLIFEAPCCSVECSKEFTRKWADTFKDLPEDWYKPFPDDDLEEDDDE